MAKIDSDSLGIDIGQSHITAVRLVQQEDRIQTLGVYEIGLPQGTLTPEGRLAQPAVITKGLKELLKQIKPKAKRVYIAINGAQLAIQPMKRPRNLEGDALNSSVRLEIEPSLPYDREYAHISYTVLGALDDGETMRVLTVACHEDVPVELMRAIQSAGLAAEDIEPAPCVLPRSIDVGCDEKQSDLLLSIGMLTSSVSIVRGGVTQYAQSLGLGADNFTQALVELGYDQTEAESWKRQHSLIAPEHSDPYPDERAALQGVADNLVEGLYQLLSYEDQGEHPTRLVICGGGAQLSGLRAHLRSSLGMPVEIAEPTEGLDVNNPDLFARHALAYALAMHPQKGKPDHQKRKPRKERRR